MITLDDDYRFEDWGFYVEEGHEHPAMPYFERKTLAISGRAGLWDFGTEIREKSFNLPIASLYTHKKDQAKLQQKLNNFVAFLFDEFGQPREIKLVYDYEPDKFYTVKISDSFTPERVRPFAKFVLPLVADDPYKYSNVFADEVTWGSEDITFESDYLFGHKNDFGEEFVRLTGPDTLKITVSGLAINPIFIIKGTANKLTISANGYSFTLPDFENTEWEIDFRDYVVFKNGKDTMVEIRDFKLLPGTNEINVTGSNVNLELAVKYHDKYN